MSKLLTINLLKRLSRHNYSTKPALKEPPDNAHNKQLKDFERISNISQRARTKQPQKPPFIKNVFLGNFDTDMLTYPQLSKEESVNLEKNLGPVADFLRRPDISQCDRMTREFRQNLSQNKLIGLQASQLMDGRESNVTESCRFIESLAELPLKHCIVHNEQLGVQILNKFGTDKQKRKYLEGLITGELLSTFCVVEANESDQINDKAPAALLQQDAKTWVVHSSNALVLNGQTADIFILLVHTDSVNKGQMYEKKYTVFITERDFGGITSKPCDTINSALELTDITFNDLRIPVDNMIGRLNHGDEILNQIYPEYRLGLGLINLALSKSLINNVTDHLIRTSTELQPIYDTDSVLSKIAQMTTSLYAIESMIYLTAGLLDNYENQDCELEAAIVKIFSSEQTHLNATTCLSLVGEKALLQSHWCNQLYREATTGLTLSDNNENLKLLIALLGLRYAGQEMNEVIKKIRNPLYNAAYVFKRMWKISRQEEDNPKLNLYLHQYLHPSAVAAANCLEYSVIRVQYTTELLLSRNGAEVVEKHMDLRRLACCLIDIYAMTACLGRASRAYCIGLQHGNYEMNLATAFCFEARERVKSNIHKTVQRYQVNDDTYRHIGKRVFKFRNYFPEHPLKWNF